MSERSLTVVLLDVERRSIGCTAASSSAVVMSTPSCGVHTCWCPPVGVSKAGKAGGALKVASGGISRGAFACAGGGSERDESVTGWKRRGGGGPAREEPEPGEPLLVEPLPADAALANALG